MYLQIYLVEFFVCVCNEKGRNGIRFFYVSLRAVVHMDVNHFPLTLTQPYVIMAVFAEKMVFALFESGFLHHTPLKLIN